MNDIPIGTIDDHRQLGLFGTPTGPAPATETTGTPAEVPADETSDPTPETQAPGWHATREFFLKSNVRACLRLGLDPGPWQRRLERAPAAPPTTTAPVGARRS